MITYIDDIKKEIAKFDGLARSIVARAEAAALNAARAECGDDLTMIVGIDPAAYISFECVTENESLSDDIRQAAMAQIKMSGRKFISEGFIADPVLRNLDARDLYFALRLDDSDVDMAKRLLLTWSDRIRFSKALGGLAWDGVRWRIEEQDDAAAYRAAQEVTEMMGKEACVARIVYQSELMPEMSYCVSKKDAKEAREALPDAWIVCHEELVSRAKSVKSVKMLNAMVAIAKNHLSIEAGDVDTQPNLLSTPAGTINLRTGEVTPNDPANLITRQTPINVPVKDGRVDFDPANAPVWLKALEDALLGDKELIDYVQRMVGYIITGETREQKIFFLYGSGSNMKGRFTTVLKNLIPDHYTKVPVELMMRQHGNRKQLGGTNETIADLRGVRMIHFEESSAEDVLDEGPMKAMSGEGDFKAAKKFRSELRFKPVGKIMGEMNHRPRVLSQDKAVWRRMVEIPFLAHFANPGDEGYEEGVSKPKDPYLNDKLEGEMPHILAWAAEGARAYYGNRGLGDEPQAVIDARQAYKEEVDVLGDFISGCCKVNPHLRSNNGDIYRAYVAFTEANANGTPIKSSTFKNAMRERGFDSKKIGSGMWRLGISLNEEGLKYAEGSYSTSPQRSATLTVVK